MAQCMYEAETVILGVPFAAIYYATEQMIAESAHMKDGDFGCSYGSVRGDGKDNPKTDSTA